MPDKPYIPGVATTNAPVNYWGQGPWLNPGTEPQEQKLPSPELAPTGEGREKFVFRERDLSGLFDGSNKPATNYLVNLAKDISRPEFRALTNIPNSLVVNAHGGEGRQGFYGNDLVKLEEIASQMGSATNDVKTAIINSCYAAGYTPDDIKRYFPNINRVLMAEDSSKPTNPFQVGVNLVGSDASTYLDTEYAKLNPPEENEARRNRHSKIGLYKPDGDGGMKYARRVLRSSDWMTPEENRSVTNSLGYSPSWFVR